MVLQKRTEKQYSRCCKVGVYAFLSARSFPRKFVNSELKFFGIIALCFPFYVPWNFYASMIITWYMTSCIHPWVVTLKHILYFIISYNYLKTIYSWSGYCFWCELCENFSPKLWLEYGKYSWYRTRCKQIIRRSK